MGKRRGGGWGGVVEESKSVGEVAGRCVEKRQVSLK